MIVTHSPALARKAEKIFYFEDGTITREGTKEELADLFLKVFGENILVNNDLETGLDHQSSKEPSKKLDVKSALESVFGEKLVLEERVK